MSSDQARSVTSLLSKLINTGLHWCKT